MTRFSFGIFFARQREQTLGIQMLAGLIDQIEQNLPLAREPNALLFQRIFDAGNRHEGKLEDLLEEYQN